MMDLLERMRDVRDPQSKWPVGDAALTQIESVYGHDDSRFSPPEYGDYLVTSNEVYSAASLRARLMSSLDLDLFSGRGPEKEQITSGPAFELLQHVNPFWTPKRLARMDELAMCLWGETYWAVEKSPTGQPTEIWWMKPSRVTPVPDTAGYLRGFLYDPLSSHEPIAFDADEVVWFRYPNPLDEFSALSPLAAARLPADTAKMMMRSNSKLFENGFNVGGMMMPKTGTTYSPEQARELEQQLEQRFKGADKSHRWAVLRFEAQLEGTAVSPKDAEFIDGLHLTLEQIGNAYGIPAPLLNHNENATLANLREFQKALWEHGLVPDATLKSSEIEEQFLPMFRGRGRSSRVDHAAFDFSKIAALQESSTAVWDRERQQVEAGLITINEWRKKNGLPPVDWGDVFWAPINKAPVSSADDAPSRDDMTSDEAQALVKFHEEVERSLGPLEQSLNGKEHHAPA